MAEWHLITCEYPPPPRDMLMTLAPLSAAKRMASAMSAVVPPPKWLSTFTGISVASKATPATPSLLLVACAMVPVARSDSVNTSPTCTSLPRVAMMRKSTDTCQPS